MNTPVSVQPHKHIATLTVSPAFLNKQSSLILYPKMSSVKGLQHLGGVTKKKKESTRKRPSPAVAVKKKGDSYTVKKQLQPRDSALNHLNTLASTATGLKKMKMKKASTSKNAGRISIGKGKQLASSITPRKSVGFIEKAKQTRGSERPVVKKAKRTYSAIPSYHWSLMQKPDCSKLDTAAIERAQGPLSSFVPDVPGLYVFELRMNAQGVPFTETLKVYVLANGESENLATDSAFVYSLSSLSGAIPPN